MLCFCAHPNVADWSVGWMVSWLGWPFVRLNNEHTLEVCVRVPPFRYACVRVCLFVPHFVVVVMSSYHCHYRRRRHRYRHRHHCHNCVTKQIFYLLRSRDNESYLFCLWHKFSFCYALRPNVCVRDLLALSAYFYI